MPNTNLNIQEAFDRAQLVAIGGSAGSFDPLLEILEGIPTHSQKVWIVMLHRQRQQKTQLVQLLEYHSSLPVKEAEDKEQLIGGHVYIAPANYHLLIEQDLSCELDAGNPVHFCRPSIDVLFDSLALSLGKNCCTILLSGANADGARGMEKVKSKGGLCLLQDPNSATYATMPEKASELKAYHALVPGTEFRSLIKRLHQ